MILRDSRKFSIRSGLDNTNPKRKRGGWSPGLNRLACAFCCCAFSEV